MDPRRLLANTADTLLEGTIIGSFTNIGYGARAGLFEWADDGADLDGQIAIVTGGTTGIGRATVAGLAELGAEVHLTSRQHGRAAAAAHDAAGDGATVVGHELDLGSFDSIRAFASGLLDALAGRGIDILIHNAGALTSDRRVDDRGMELTLSTHLVGPYLLTELLRPHLNSGARLLFMSSGGMYTQRLEVAALEMSEGSYKGAIAYARAKRAQVELVTMLGPQWAPEVVVHAVHPGWVDTPGVDAGLPGFGRVMGPLLRTPEQGADTMVWLATTGGGDVGAGRFWLDRRPRRTVYVPGTATDDAERCRLVEWLDDQIAGALERTDTDVVE